MRKVLGIIASVFAVFFSVPTGLILASWNALPGDSLYTTKRAMENVALVVVKSTPLASSFSVSFTDRRFKEADKLLTSKGSTLGYSLLVEQAQQSKDIIVDQKNTQQADQFVANLDQYEQLIEAKKSAVIAQAQQYNQTPVTNQPTQTTTQAQPTYTSPAQPGTTTATTTQTFPSQPTQTNTIPAQPQPQQTQPQVQQPSAPQVPAQAPVQQPIQAPQNIQQIQQTIAQLDQAKQNLEKIKNEVKHEVPSSERARENRQEQPSQQAPSDNNPQGGGKGHD